MKKKIMLHIIMPNQVSGPNTSAKKIAESYLNSSYEFGYLIQEQHAKGKINIALLRSLIKQIKEFDPDLIHLSGLQSSGFHAVLAARLAGYHNILLTVRGFAGDAIGISKFKNFLFTMIFEPLTIKLSKGVTIVTKESLNKKMIKKIKSQKKFLGVIYNVAPELEEQSSSTRIKKREELGIIKEDFVISIVGRMVYDKGIVYILEAIEKIENKNIKFLFVGDGPYLEIIQNRYPQFIKNKKIILTGKSSEVSTLLLSSEVFLFATLHENLSNALLEAMAVGLPIICTEVGGNKEVLENGINGLFIKPKSSEDIVDKIKYMYNNRDELEQYSKESKRIIQSKFSQEVIYPQIDEIYKRFTVK